MNQSHLRQAQTARDMVSEWRQQISPPRGKVFEEDISINEPLFRRSMRKNICKYEYFYGPFINEKVKKLEQERSNQRDKVIEKRTKELETEIPEGLKNLKKTFAAQNNHRRRQTYSGLHDLSIRCSSRTDSPASN